MLDTRTTPKIRTTPSFGSEPIMPTQHGFRLADAPWISAFQWAALGGALTDTLLTGGSSLEFVAWWLMVSISMLLSAVGVRLLLARTQGQMDPVRALGMAGLVGALCALLPLTPWGLMQGLGALVSGSLSSLMLQMLQFGLVAALLVPVVSVRAASGENTRWPAVAIGALVFGVLTLLF